MEQINFLSRAKIKKQQSKQTDSSHIAQPKVDIAGVKLKEPDKDTVSLSKNNNGKFDISECIKNFVKGVISPLTAIIKHPLMTTGVVGVTIAACRLIPVLGPILAIGFGGLSVFQLGKGIYDVVKNYKNKIY